MSNIAILCLGADDTSRQEKVSHLTFLASKITSMKTIDDLGEN